MLAETVPCDLSGAWVAKRYTADRFLSTGVPVTFSQDGTNIRVDCTDSICPFVGAVSDDCKTITLTRSGDTMHGDVHSEVRSRRTEDPFAAAGGWFNR